jgi:hypothetical protein
MPRGCASAATARVYNAGSRSATPTANAPAKPSCALADGNRGRSAFGNSLLAIADAPCCTMRSVAGLRHPLTTWSALDHQGFGFAAWNDRTQQGSTSLRNLLGRAGAHAGPGIAIIEPISADDQARDQSGAGQYPQQQDRPWPILDSNRPALLVMSCARRVSDVLGRSLASATEVGCPLPPRSLPAGRRRRSRHWVQALPRRVLSLGSLHHNGRCLGAPLV